MNVFGTVKANINTREAAARYGVEVNRHGKALCPFHNDRHPSLFVDDDHYHCYACGEHGDVIDFTAKLHGLTLYDAAKKLAYDFGITQDKPPTKAMQEKQNRKSEAQRLRENEKLCFSALLEYSRMLQEWMVLYAPKTPEDKPDDRFVEACHWLAPAEYYLDILIGGDSYERNEVIEMLMTDGKLKKLQEHLKNTGRRGLMSKKKDDCMEEQPGWYNGQFLDEVGFCCDFICRHPMVCVGGKFFSKEGRIHDENGIKKQIYEMLRPYLKSGLAKKCSNLLEMLRMEAYKDTLPVHEDRLHVANGTLFVKGEFSERKEFCRNRLPVKYNPDAPQPVTWLHFLSELLEDEDILTLQEYLGYCLIPTTRGQTMMLLKGNGGEGKSRIGVVMQAMLGANLKNGSIAKVERSPFARADLEHELVMVDDDMKMEALKSTHYLKFLITAEMPMDLERKGEQSYQGEMYVRFLAFSNGNLESLYDHSDGFYRRQLILSVKKKPLDREDDPFLADKLVAEVEGIFLWCLEGLRRLIANNYRFSESSRTKDNREQARRDADNVLLFLRSEGYIRLKADSTITSADLYAIYCIWCNDNTYKPLAARTVSMTLKKHADEFGLEHDNHITNSLGKQVNGFWGIEALISPGIL